MSFFRTPINPEVQKELFRRIEGVNKRYITESLEPIGDPLENEYFKSCWARVVTIDNNDNLYYLNSQLGSDGKTPITEPLNIKDGNPYRGRAGITSITSTHKEFFLKQSTISFTCPDPKEFEELQDHFLKHGRYVLVEFGWSTRKNIELDVINTNNLVRFSNNLRHREINSKGNYTAICGVITNFNFNQQQDGSYQGTFEVSSMGRNLLGQKIQTDGKIENLVQYVTEKVNDAETNPELKGLSKEQIKNFKRFRETFVNFHSTIKALPEVIKDYVESNEYYLDTDGDAVESKAFDGVGTAIRSRNNAAYIPLTHQKSFLTPNESKSDLAYCTWGWFEDYILNSFFAFTSKVGDTEETFKTRFFSTDDISFYEDGKVKENRSTLCRNNPKLYSLGLQSVILPGQFKRFNPSETGTPEGNITLETFLGAVYKPSTAELAKVYLPDGAKKFYDTFLNTEYQREQILRSVIEHFNQKNNFEPFFVNKDDKVRGKIRNMVFEANYLMESFIGTTNVDASLMKFWQKVSNDYGNFWRFSIVEDDNTDGKIKVVDLNIGETDDTEVLSKISTPAEPNQIFKFPLYEKNSFIQDFSLQTSYDSEMATMAVFGSNANLSKTRGDMGQGYTELAVRALSLLQHARTKESLQEEKDKTAFFDAVLKDIETPITSNKEQRGSRSEKKFDNEISRVVQEMKGGIIFPRTKEILYNKDKILEEAAEVNLYDTTDSGIRKGYFWFTNNDKTVQIYSSSGGQILQEFKRTMLYYINKSSSEDDSSNYNVVLPAVPLQLSLTIQGTGGIKIGDLFYIDYLPQVYREYCHFMVVNVDHEISTTGWTTKLDSRMIVDIPKLIKKLKDTEPELLTKITFDPFIVPVNEQLDDFVKKMQSELENTSEQVLANVQNKELHSYYGKALDKDKKIAYASGPYDNLILVIRNIASGLLTNQEPLTEPDKILEVLKDSVWVKNSLLDFKPTTNPKDTITTQEMIDMLETDNTFIQRVLDGEILTAEEMGKKG